MERPLQNRMTNAMVNDQMTIAQGALWVIDTLGISQRIHRNKIFEGQDLVMDDNAVF